MNDPRSSAAVRRGAHLKSLCVGVGVAILACTPRPTAAPQPPIYSPLTDSARTLVAALVKQQRLPGLAATVSVGEDVVWHEGFGFADVSTGAGVTADTKFRVGSVSKLFTATLLMRLHQEGRIELDAPVGGLLELPRALAPLTPRQLAGHVGGVRHYRGNEFLTTTHYSTLRDGLSVFTGDSLVAAPGSRYAYSSYGYNLLGAALEAASTTPFPDLLKRYVLDPLRMTATVADVAGTRIAGRARTYSLGADDVSDVAPDDLSGRWPSGGFLSSTDDLARLGRAMLAPGFLNEQSLKTMLTPQRLTSGAMTSVGIGWRISTDSAGRRYVHHGGSSNGGAAFLLVYPEQRLVVAMASNAFAQWGEKDALALAALFLQRPER